jgi:hypothetical protein
LLLINIFNLQHFFFLTNYVSWTWAEPNRAVCRDACVEWRPPKKGATVRWQLRSTFRGMFVQPFYFISYYFLELNMMISSLIFRRPIIDNWGRVMRMILRPIWISIRICGWRQDRMVDPIKIRCTGSPTLRLRTCGRLVVSQRLGAPNQYWAPNLRSSWPCSNTRLISLENTSDSRQIMKNSVKWLWTLDLFFYCLVSGMTNILLLL